MVFAFMCAASPVRRTVRTSPHPASYNRFAGPSPFCRQSAADGEPRATMQTTRGDSEECVSNAVHSWRMFVVTYPRARQIPDEYISPRPWIRKVGLAGWRDLPAAAPREMLPKCTVRYKPQEDFRCNPAENRRKTGGPNSSAGSRPVGNRRKTGGPFHHSSGGKPAGGCPSHSGGQPPGKHIAIL